MRIEESDPTDTDTEPNTQFQKPKIEISESELEQLKHDNSPDAKARVLKTLTESKPFLGLNLTNNRKINLL